MNVKDQFTRLTNTFPNAYVSISCEVLRPRYGNRDVQVECTVCIQGDDIGHWQETGPDLDVLCDQAIAELVSPADMDKAFAAMDEMKEAQS